MLAIAVDDADGFVFSQVNHYLQFPVLVTGFAAIQRRLPLERAMALWPVRLAAIASCLATVGYQLARTGYVHEFTLSLVVLLLVLVQPRPKGNGIARWALLAVLVIGLLAVMPRASSQMILGLFVLVRLTAWPVRLVRFACLVLIAAPVVVYLLVDTDQLLYLRQIDHNTFIRAEFIRAASTLLVEHPLAGIGFGVEYRPLNFSYLEVHRLTAGLVEVNTVTNHHSVFDVALRLGIPAAMLFVYGVFLRPGCGPGDRIQQFALLMLGVNLSLNAWLEDQAQIAMVSLLVATVLVRGTRAQGGRNGE